MKNLKKVMAVFITLVIFASTFSIDASAATTTVKNQFDFIDVYTGTSIGKGDATLITQNNKYYLVDCGPSEGYSKLYAKLNSYCKRVNNKIVIEELIISHNHSDHMGAIDKLMSDKNITVKHVSYTGVGPESNITKIRKYVPKANRTTIHVGEIKTITGTTIKMFGPSKDYTNGDTSTCQDEDVNDSSMVVTVDGEISGILLGDLAYRGLMNFFVKYGNKIYGSKNSFTVCKVGHHGLRRYSSDKKTREKTIMNEAYNYRSRIKARCYVMTSSTTKIKSETILSDNYALLKQKLRINNAHILRGNSRVSSTCISADIFSI